MDRRMDEWNGIYAKNIYVYTGLSLIPLIKIVPLNS